MDMQKQNEIFYNIWYGQDSQDLIWEYKSLKEVKDVLNHKGSIEEVDFQPDDYIEIEKETRTWTDDQSFTRDFKTIYEGPVKDFNFNLTESKNNSSLEGKILKNDGVDLPNLLTKIYGKGTFNHEGNFKFKYTPTNKKSILIYTEPTDEEKQDKIKIKTIEESFNESSDKSPLLEISYYVPHVTVDGTETDKLKIIENKDGTWNYNTLYFGSGGKFNNKDEAYKAFEEEMNSNLKYDYLLDYNISTNKDEAQHKIEEYESIYKEKFNESLNESRSKYVYMIDYEDSTGSDQIECDDAKDMLNQLDLLINKPMGMKDIEVKEIKKVNDNHRDEEDNISDVLFKKVKKILGYTPEYMEYRNKSLNESIDIEPIDSNDNKELRQIIKQMYKYGQKAKLTPELEDLKKKYNIVLFKIHGGEVILELLVSSKEDQKSTSSRFIELHIPENLIDKMNIVDIINKKRSRNKIHSFELGGYDDDRQIDSEQDNFQDKERIRDNLILSDRHAEQKSLLKSRKEYQDGLNQVNQELDKLKSTKIESLKEDTIKQGDKWVNKGKEGTHGKFTTKKAASAQRKAMFANGYKESLTKNPLKQAAEFAKKHQKGKGWFVHPNIEKGVPIFNKNMNPVDEKVPTSSSAPSPIVSGSADGTTGEVGAVVENLNIREKLNDWDKEDYKDYLNMYESLNLNDDQKINVAHLLLKEDKESTFNYLSDLFKKSFK